MRLRALDPLKSFLSSFASAIRIPSALTANLARWEDSEQTYRSMLESSIDCIKLLDLEGRLLSFNRNGCALMEIDDVCALIGENWFSFWNERDAQGARRAFDAAKAGGTGHFEGYCPTMKNTPKWWDIIVSPVFDSKGNVEKILAVSRDITDRKKAQETLDSTQNELALLKHALDAAAIVAITDRRGTITYVNDTFCEISGYSRQELLGQNHRILNSGLHSKEFFREMWKTIAQGNSWRGDIRNRAKDGSIYWVDTFIVPTLDAAGRPTRYLSIRNDITERKLAEQALEEAKEQLRAAKESAEQANQAKSRFLANMSHEIRSPMNALLGYADLLAEKELPETERLAYADRIRSSGEHLIHIINDILDLSKVEAGRLDIIKRRFSPVSVASECVRSMSVLAMKKNISLHFSIENAVPREIESDDSRFRQILTNLLSNSLKFTEAGQIHVRMQFDDGQANGGASGGQRQQPHLKIQVEDSGIGIQTEKHHQLFQPFMQADASVTRKYGGTGLGLSLSKHLAAALGGELCLRWSEPGKGSCFEFSVTCGDIADGELTEVAHESNLVDAEVGIPSLRCGRLEGIRILVVDDSVDNQSLMQIHLGKERALVHVAENGREGMEMALCGEFDVILMDVAMPVMDGLEATSRLRMQGYKGPIIALTAHALTEEVSKSFKAGCDAHLSKPVSRRDLVETILKHVKSVSERTTATALPM